MLRAHRLSLPFISILAGCVGVWMPPSSFGESPPTPPQESVEFLQAWCIDCHGGSKPKGKFSLDDVINRLADSTTTAADRSVLRKALQRLAESEMPPADADELPSPDERATGVDALRSELASARPEVVPRSGPPRRLNRAEYSNTIRDLFGIDLRASDGMGSLPPDDVGAGFDNIGSVLSLSPTAFEKYFDLAESIASRASPEVAATAPISIVVEGRSMAITEGAGRALERVGVLWSRGEARTRVELPRVGTYSISLLVGGNQAGPDPVRMGLLDGKTRIADCSVSEDAKSPGVRRIEHHLSEGAHSLAVTFDNDYYEKDGPGGKSADRNAVVHSMTIEGPLETYRVPHWRRPLDAALAGKPNDQRLRDSQVWLVERVLRRPATETDRALLDQVTASLPASASEESRVKATIETLLVHPEFLFRIEGDPTDSPSDLAPSELATRMSYFIWASCPDETLASKAEHGDLSTVEGRRIEIDRLLQDHRSSSLADRFATQWLAIDGLGQTMPDSTQFPDVDLALLRSMRAETVMFFESVLREGRPIDTLVDADFTFVDARLARHYGILSRSVDDNDAMVRVPVDPARGGGVLAHASVLTATSNPTRTSPVKRGKWVLESLLDAAPPPPPPGTNQIPDRVEDRQGKSIRELMEIHRSDPNCAACHRRMDALGFAFEGFDPVGRARERVDGNPVDAIGTLPDGTTLTGLAGVRAKLREHAGFTRSLVRHLMTYATGCAQDEKSDDEIDQLIRTLPTRPKLSDIVHAIVESPSFRMRTPNG